MCNYPIVYYYILQSFEVRINRNQIDQRQYFCHVLFCNGSPATGATWDDLGNGKFKVTYTEANQFLFRCTVTDNDSLDGMGSVPVTVRTPEGSSFFTFQLSCHFALGLNVLDVV